MPEAEKSYQQVWFMPWANLRDEVQVGPVKFWPFIHRADEKIPNDQLRKFLKRYFNCYTDHQGKPVDTVTICSCDPIDFNPLTKSRSENVRRAVDALIFSIIAPNTKGAVCANNSSMGPPSTDRYQLFGQNFQVGEDFVAVQSGNLLSGGWKIGEIMFPKPWSIGGAFDSPDPDLLQGFTKVFDDNFPSDVQERIFRSLEWFRLAHTGADEVSSLSKLVMMSTAFEVLLQFPSNGKRKHFTTYIEMNLRTKDSLTALRSDHKRKSYTLSLAACWAWDFYELRSRIVHGDHVALEEFRYRDWINHLIVADLVFWECLTRELYVHKCIGDNVRAAAADFDKAFSGEANETSEPFWMQLLFGFDDVHQALGWVVKKPLADS